MPFNIPLFVAEAFFCEHFTFVGCPSNNWFALKGNEESRKGAISDGKYKERTSFLK